MRAIIQQQLPLVPNRIEHVHGRELEEMSRWLDETPEAAKLVYADLTRGEQSVRIGRRGMTAEQVVRALLVKQLRGFSYEELSFHLADSSTYRRFCRIGVAERVPAASTLQGNIARIEVETLEAINRLLVKVAQAKGIERGQRTRVDCTVTESPIHPPSDSSLLWDCVRVLTRLLVRTNAMVRFGFTNHVRRAKYLSMKIDYARRHELREQPYKELLRVTETTVRNAYRAMERVAAEPRGGKLLSKLRHFIGMAEAVIDQTRRRVDGGEKVPASDKIVSIFEPHTSIIRKGGRETHFGHKLCLAVGPSGVVSDCLIETGNPADRTLTVRMIDRHREVFGQVPHQAAFDGGFASKANLAQLKETGVTDVSFSKRCGLKITDMVRSTWIYRRLKRFRAGIEGHISFLKRALGLNRCTWRGFTAFKRYIWSSLLTANLLVLARHNLE